MVFILCVCVSVSLGEPGQRRENFPELLLSVETVRRSAGVLQHPSGLHCGQEGGIPAETRSAHRVFGLLNQSFYFEKPLHFEQWQSSSWLSSVSCSPAVWWTKRCDQTNGLCLCVLVCSRVNRKRHVPVQGDRWPHLPAAGPRCSGVHREDRQDALRIRHRKIRRLIIKLLRQNFSLTLAQPSLQEVVITNINSTSACGFWKERIQPGRLNIQAEQ